MQHRLSSAYEEISSLRSLLVSRSARWEIATQSVKFQDKLRWARKKISSLEQSSKGKVTIVDLKVRGPPSTIISILVRPPLIGSHPSSGG